MPEKSKSTCVENFLLVISTRLSSGFFGAVCVVVGVGVGVLVGVSVGLNPGVAVTVGVAVLVTVFVGVAVLVTVFVGVTVLVTVLVGVCVGVFVLVGVFVGVTVFVGVKVGVRVGVLVNVGVNVGGYDFKFEIYDIIVKDVPKDGSIGTIKPYVKIIEGTVTAANGEEYDLTDYNNPDLDFWWEVETEVDDLIDEFIEVLMGKYGRVKSESGFKIELSNYEDLNTTDFVDKYIDYLVKEVPKGLISLRKALLPIR